MKKIYVCSPYKSYKKGRTTHNNLDNLSFAADICMRIIQQGDIPIASHVFYAKILQNGKEETDYARTVGLSLAKGLIKDCDEMWVCKRDGYMSEGMELETEYAAQYDVPCFIK